MDHDDNVRSKMVLACRRTGLRHRLRHANDASVDLTLGDGRTWRFDLLDIGSGGVCFGLDGDQPAMEQGTVIGRAILRVSGAGIEGSVTIAHATEEFASGIVCGARFVPATDADRQKLEQAIASLVR